MDDDNKTEYARQQEAKHRRRIVLPSVIPWECGSNKYASQKGCASFGTIRNANLPNVEHFMLAIFCIELTIHSSKQLSESNDGVVPQITCPPLHKKRASQAGESSFGNFREQVTRVVDKDGDEKVAIARIVDDKMTETMLKKWNQPNKVANNSDIGRRRGELAESCGGRRFTTEELTKSRACIPRFQDPRQTVAAMDYKTGDGFQGGMPRQRQTVTSVEGNDRTVFDQLDTNRYMAWLGGQLTLQSQSGTGGFMKPRDVASMNYYDKLMQNRQTDLEKVKERLKEEKRIQDEQVEEQVDQEEQEGEEEQDDVEKEEEDIDDEDEGEPQQEEHPFSQSN